ncbi:MAG: hypothetical protein K0Q94_6747 [Paenibacillus sp.]|uniref:hypothetical protein n=1 Tax=Paenibacillus sp. GCM10012303 TaxID=3317340 RepID=UPI0029ED69F7|nr:hypothetical protein [Paenibacillus sp.]
MSSLCPYCNGMTALNLQCPQCGNRLFDGGRLDDYLGPYSPYRAIDDLKLTNGYPDLDRRLCVHQTYCESCGYRQEVQAEEWLT